MQKNRIYGFEPGYRKSTVSQKKSLPARLPPPKPAARVESVEPVEPTPEISEAEDYLRKRQKRRKFRPQKS